MKETARAAPAPAMAYSAGIGRSLAPPMPWAKTTSDDLGAQGATGGAKHRARIAQRPHPFGERGIDE
jgi:hypothetical protein